MCSRLVIYDKPFYNQMLCIPPLFTFLSKNRIECPTVNDKSLQPKNPQQFIPQKQIPYYTPTRVYKRPATISTTIRLANRSSFRVSIQAAHHKGIRRIPRLNVLYFTLTFQHSPRHILLNTFLLSSYFLIFSISQYTPLPL